MNWLNRFRVKRRLPLNASSVENNLTFEKLEPRILLSADAIGGAIDSHDLAAPTDPDDASAQSFRTALLQQLADNTRPSVLPMAIHSAVVDAADWSGLEQLYSSAEDAVNRVELVVVDQSVPDYQQLVDGITSDSSVQYQILLLNAADDPLAAIGTELTQLQRVDAVHLVGHGEAGTMALGGLSLTSENIDHYQERLGHWRGTLSLDADILIYGCDVAASPAGQDLLNRLGSITGADIAASDDVTGHGINNADWELEFYSGNIETALAFGLDVQQSWQHTLLLITVDANGDWVNPHDNSVTLREAINAVNEDALANPSGVHTINFNLTPGTTILLSESLPDIYASVTIDASSVVDVNGDPGITLTGGTSGIVLRGDGITVQGLRMDGMTEHGVLVFGSGNSIVDNHIINSGASGIHVVGNGNSIIGNTIAGNTHYGVYISGADNTVGGALEAAGNVVSDNGMSGVRIDSVWAYNNVVQGNYIGLTANGQDALGNARHGVEVSNGAASSLIGGSIAGAGNVISANGADGISISSTDGTAGSNVIAGNIIGLDASGTLDRGNAQHGISFIDSPSNTIGGIGEYERNIISGNGGDGINLVTDSYGALIANNYIGTDITGTRALGNTGYGIHIDGASDWEGKPITRIGAPTGGNVIAANASGGVFLTTGAYNIDVMYNKIGVSGDGETALGNGGDGILVDTGIYSAFSFTPSNINIKFNDIAHNSGAGVSVTDLYTYAVTVAENRIHSNTGIAIDLAGDGLTANDDANRDGDIGPNTRANFPVLSSVESVDGRVRISGSFTTDYAAGTTVVLHFYASDAAHASGSGESQRYIGAVSVVVASGGTTSFDASLLADVPANSYISATATGRLGTSEVSLAALFAEGNYVDYDPTGTVTISGALVQGALLTVANTLADANGVASPITYQWRRDGVIIEGAQGAEHRLAQEDVGAHLSVEASFVDGNGNTETVTSAATTAIGNDSFDPTGAPTVVGDLIEHAALTGDIGTLADADNIAGGISYQWLRNGSEIAGANLQSYTLSNADVGASVSVRATYLDGDGNRHSVDSALYGPVVNVNDAPEGEVTIDGIAAEYQLLTAQIDTLGDADGLPSELSYQWYREGVAITGSTASTYALTSADVGGRVSVAVSYVDGGGKLETVMSAATTAVANTNDEPVGSVVIEGAAAEQSVLTATHALEDKDGLANAFSYQWYRDGIAVEGAAATTYLLSAEDIGAVITVTVSYVDGGGTQESVTSAGLGPVANVNDAPEGQLLIEGEPVQYSVLSVTHSITDADGVSQTPVYQWLRNGEVIDGEFGETYTLSQEDVGSTIQVRMRYQDDHGAFESVTSEPTAVIANTNDRYTGGVEIAGIAAEHEVLTAVDSIADLDGLPDSYNYQWFRGGVAIEGANAATYALVAEDIGHNIYVEMTYLDGGGTRETTVSSEVGPVANTNDAPQGGVFLQGSAVEFEALTVSHTLADADGLPEGIGYIWYRDGIVIEGVSGTSYTLVDRDIGTKISVEAVYEDAHGTQERVLSAPTAAVANTNSSPEGELTINGTAIKFSTLTVVNGLYDADGTPSVMAYQWLRDGTAIDGATDASYLLTAEDVGARIQVQVMYQDNHGTSEAVLSAAVGPVAQANSPGEGAIEISGQMTEHATLTALPTLSDTDGITGEYTFQWYRDGEAIAGAMTDQYRLVADDIGASITVSVAYQDGLGSREVLSSAPTAAIANTNDVPSGAVTITGVAAEYQTLTSGFTIADADGHSGAVSYQWYRAGTAVAGATDVSYVLGRDDVDNVISVAVSYTDDHGTNERLLSAATEAVVATNNLPSGAFDIIGDPRPGAVLSISHNLDDIDGIAGEIRWQWQRDGLAIEGATGTTYQLTEDDRDTTISVIATFVDKKGFEEVVLSELLDVAPAAALYIAEAEPASIKPQPLSTQISNPAVEQPVEQSAAEEQTTVTVVVADQQTITASARYARQPVLGGLDQLGSDLLPRITAFAQDNPPLQSVTVVPFSPNSAAFTAASLNSVFPSLSESMAILHEKNYSNTVEQSVEEIADGSITLSAAVVGGSAALSAGLSVGYLVWTLRSGILITSLLSSMPAWRFIDPLPILGGRLADGEDVDDDESLESLVAEDESEHAPEETE